MQTEVRLCAVGRESWSTRPYNSHSRPASLVPLRVPEKEWKGRPAEDSHNVHLTMPLPELAEKCSVGNGLTAYEMGT